ncbi:AraC family transcriptional regulator [Vibrio litoralis]|uniref:AraC family transcriptional regulator n=1 Tax=Vibrio litoralis TaxID=335972 RepID=UPI00040291DE|nr:helix-turn-helix transcriptional regulator [Vibrio litoralis]
MTSKDRTSKGIVSPTFMPKLVDQLPSSVFVHYFHIAGGTETETHLHDWGQVHLIKQGVLEMEVNGRKMVSPAGFAIWTPAQVPHRAFNRQDIEYCAINIDVSRTHHLPSQACMIALPPLVLAIIDDLVARKVDKIESHQDTCLTDVLLERLASAHRVDDFLPTTTDLLLQPILAELEANPTNNCPMSEWAKRAFTTERTLHRRFQKHLRMSFNEWRQRLKVVTALQLLKQAESINQVAYQLGYSDASAFIKMFRKHTGLTPAVYRQQITTTSEKEAE